VVKPLHRRGQYTARAREVVRAAEARDMRAARGECEPTICWRCGLPLAQHPPHPDGTPQRWTCGHTRDGDPTAPLLAEASRCNFKAGAAAGNRRRRVRMYLTTRRWWSAAGPGGAGRRRRGGALPAARRHVSPTKRTRHASIL